MPLWWFLCYAICLMSRHHPLTKKELPSLSCLHNVTLVIGLHSVPAWKLILVIIESHICSIWVKAATQLGWQDLRWKSILSLFLSYRSIRVKWSHFKCMIVCEIATIFLTHAHTLQYKGNLQWLICILCLPFDTSLKQLAIRQPCEYWFQLLENPVPPLKYWLPCVLI